MVTNMFVVTEAEAAAIRAAFERGGELAGAVELRRQFPGIVDNTQARIWARMIAGWKPLNLPPKGSARLQFGRGRRGEARGVKRGPESDR
jgi:hypothetical protein